jgi:hypothetical protein
MSDDPTAGLAHSVLGVTKYLFRVSSLAILLGLFLVLTDVVKNTQDHTVLGIRLMFFGFGWSFMSITPTLIGKPHGDEEDQGWLRVKMARLFDRNRILAIAFFALALCTRLLLSAYQHLR